MHRASVLITHGGVATLVPSCVMNLEHSPTHSLTEVVRSAGEFGLFSHEVWEAVMATPDRLPPDLRARYIDELSGELARRLVEKQRTAQDALRTVHHGLIPRRSPLVTSSSPGRGGLARRCRARLGQMAKGVRTSAT